MDSARDRADPAVVASWLKASLTRTDAAVSLAGSESGPELVPRASPAPLRLQKHYFSDGASEVYRE